MNVSEAIAARRSVRGFLKTPVPLETLRRIVAAAGRAPSGCNLQPWQIDVIGGSVIEDLRALMQQRLIDAPQGEPVEYAYNPAQLRDMPEFYRRMVDVGSALYERLGIPRDDKARRAQWFAQNFQLFGAPVALFCSVDKRMGAPQWSDMGMYLQNVLLLLQEQGLASCAQEAWSLYPQTLRRFLNIPEERMLFCGIAIGYEDSTAPANSLRTERAALDEFARFRGF